MSDQQLMVRALATALPDLSEELRASLSETMGVLRLDAGAALIREGEVDDTVYVLAEGTLSVSVGDIVLATREPGAVLGELAVLTGRARSATVTAEGDATLLTLPGAVLSAMDESTEVQRALILSAEHRAGDDALTAGLQRMLGTQAEGALAALTERAEVVRYARGEVVCLAGDDADGCYVVLNGEVVVLIDGPDGPVVVRSMGSGETLGELALLLDSKRTATVVARRDSRLARVSRADFEEIVQQNADALLALSRRLAGWLAAPRSGADDRHRVILVRPLGPGDAVRGFAERLRDDLARFGHATLLDGQTVLGRRASGDLSTLLDRIIDALRREHSFTVLLADVEPGEWTRRAEGAADLVLNVATDEHEPHAVEAVPLGDEAWRQERWLVRLHPSDRTLPTPSMPWIEALQPDVHLNVRVGDVAHSERLARLVAGRAVGIALSGGAARGFGHFGTVLALQEFGIEVDWLAGSSAGSLAAVLIAQGGDLRALAGDRVAQLMAKGNPFADVTLPVVAVLRSERIRKGLQRVFGDLRIEDLWQPVTVAVTDLGEGVLRSHQRGEAWRLTLASGSPPGLTQPVVVDGRVCCDAGVLDNLPVSLLPSLCGHRVASMVGGVSGLKIDDAEFPSPWQILRSGLFGSKKAAGPNIGQILLASTAIGANHNARQAERIADLYFEPDLSPFGTLDFGSYEGMLDAAREHALAELAASSSAGRIRDWTRGG